MRSDAQRLNHVLDILAGLGDCGCEKARVILEIDPRDAEARERAERYWTSRRARPASK